MALVGSTACLVFAGVASGCYFEGSVAYHPRITQSVSAPGDTSMVVTGDGGGWSAGINIGLYLDVMIPNRTIRGIAAGVSPGMNGYGLAPSEPVAKTATKAISVRADVTLPFTPLSTTLHTRAVGVYNWLYDTSTTIAPDATGSETETSHGRSWFLGAAIGYRKRIVNVDKVGTFVFTLAAGVERFKADLVTKQDRSVRVSSTGVGVRLLISPAMVGHPPKAPFELAPTPPEPNRSNAGCHYVDDHDNPGKQRWKCE